MKYAVLSASTPDLLMEAVNDAISQGWVPQGGVATLIRPFTGLLCFQAMVYQEPDPSVIALNESTLIVADEFVIPGGGQ